MTAFLMIFQRFLATFQRFLKILQNCSEGQTTTRRQLKKIQRCFDHTSANLSVVNVIVPGESKLIMATCNWPRAINQIQTTRDGVNGGTLPCIWLAHATSSDISPAQLNDRQHVLDWTRVLVSKRCSLVMKSLGEVAAQTKPHHAGVTLCLLCRNIWPTLSPKGGREGGKIKQ